MLEKIRAFWHWMDQDREGERICKHCDRPIAEHYERCEGDIAASRPKARLIALIVVGGFIVGCSIQEDLDARRRLRIEEQFAVVDAAKRAGKKIEYRSIYDPGTVVKE